MGQFDNIQITDRELQQLRMNKITIENMIEYLQELISNIPPNLETMSDLSALRKTINILKREISKINLKIK